MEMAKVSWCWEDIEAQILDMMDCKPEDIKMTKKEMEEFLKSISGNLKDRMIETGWDVIRVALEERYPHWREGGRYENSK